MGSRRASRSAAEASLLEEKTFENAQKLADHLAKSQLSLDKLRERAEEFDLTDSAVCYSTFDMSSPHKSGTKLDLFTEHDELDFDAVLEWQHWFLVRGLRTLTFSRDSG